MIDRIALISPYDSYLSIGLRLISSHLRRNGIQTRMIFLPAYTEIWQQLFYQDDRPSYTPLVLEQLREIIADCDAIGITMMSMDKQKVHALTSALAPLNKPTVLGGVHPTAFPEDAMTMADNIIVGEGDESLLEWCREPGRPDIAGHWFWKDGRIHENAVRPALANIDELPFPDYGPDDHLILDKGSIEPVTVETRRKFMGTMYHQFATLGCPFSCTFCINNHFRQMGEGYSSFRYHSPAYIIDEIKYGLSLSPDIEYINFPDDGFIAMKEGPLTEFAALYKREIGLPFSVMGIIPNYLNERKLEALVDAGLKRVRMGLQSSSTETLKAYKRPGKAKYYEKCNDMVQKHKGLVFPYYDIIMDNPLIDTEKDMVDTIEFLLNLNGRFTAFLYSMRMYPGTEMYQEALEKKVDKSYFDDGYFEFRAYILNYILTIIQWTGFRPLPRFLLRLYKRHGNFRVPKLLFGVSKVLFVMRCGLEHLRKGDISGLPHIVVRGLNLLRRLTFQVSPRERYDARHGKDSGHDSSHEARLTPER